MPLGKDTTNFQKDLSILMTSFVISNRKISQKSKNDTAEIQVVAKGLATSIFVVGTSHKRGENLFIKEVGQNHLPT